MPVRLLVHTRTTAYRHESIPAGVEAVRTVGDFEVDHTEDPRAFEQPLDAYSAVVFLSTSGEVLTPAGRERLAAYVESGGGFVGVHAAACTEYDWPYYGELLGARFASRTATALGSPVTSTQSPPVLEL
jgi:type 1 glutamine amidotransferase